MRVVKFCADCDGLFETSQHTNLCSICRDKKWRLYRQEYARHYYRKHRERMIQQSVECRHKRKERAKKKLETFLKELEARHENL